MSSNNIFQIVKDLQDLSDPILKENYDWVDTRLREMFYSYALTSSNCDEFETEGLLNERWACVDERLEAMCSPSEEEVSLLCPAPVTWVNYRGGVKFECLEEDEQLSGHKRSRSESEISDYGYSSDTRLIFQSPSSVNENKNYLFDNKNVLDNELSKDEEDEEYEEYEEDEEFVEADWGEFDPSPFSANYSDFEECDSIS